MHVARHTAHMVDFMQGGLAFHARHTYLASDTVAPLPARPPGLIRLIIADNDLVALPAAISSLVRLQTLDASRNALAALPPGLAGLPRLSVLTLTQNPLAGLPEGFGERLPALRDLRLSQNALPYVPPCLAAASALSHLDLSSGDASGRLSCLPDILSRLVGLVWLSASGNQLTHLPPGEALARAGRGAGAGLGGGGPQGLYRQSCAA